MPEAILLKDVETLGEKGTVVDVSKGYLRNYLIPRKLAQPATKGAINAAQSRAAAEERAAQEAIGRAADSAELLNKTVLTISQQHMRSPLTSNSRRAPPATHRGGCPPPPHSIEAEQSVLGAMLLSDRTHYAFVIEEGLKVEDFYRERHREVYESMLALFTVGDSIDVLTVTEHLRSRGRLDAAGGQAEIDALTAAVPAVGNLLQYAQIVRDRALLRRLLAASYEIQAHVHGHEAPPRELVEWAERAVLGVPHDDRPKDFRQG